MILLVLSIFLQFREHLSNLLIFNFICLSPVYFLLFIGISFKLIALDGATSFLYCIKLLVFLTFLHLPYDALLSLSYWHSASHRYQQESSADGAEILHLVTPTLYNFLLLSLTLQHVQHVFLSSSAILIFSVSTFIFPIWTEERTSLSPKTIANILFF